MKLRKKAPIIIGVTFVVMIVFLYTTWRIVLLGSFTKLEEQNTRRNVERALSALSNELSTLDATGWDWAAWDDTYAFIEDANKDYIESNLVDETLTGLRTNLMLFINLSGQIIFGKGFDLDEEEEIPIPQSLQEHLSPDNFLLRHPDTESSVTGILPLPEGPMLIGSWPILTSEDEGPIRGTLIMGRYLDEAKIKRLAKITHLSLTVRRFDDSQMPLDFQAVASSVSEETPILVRPLSEESIAGYALLKDIYGKPILILRADMPRDIYQQGQATIPYFIFSLLAISLVFGVGIMLLLEKEVLSPLADLSKTVSSIGESSDLSARVSVTGRNELSSLADEINGMLESLEQSQIERKRMEEQIKASLREKEMLLREIHHRVKNNMQLISSLLRLQSRYIKDKKYIEMLKESQNRIRSMAFIHEKLYQSKDLANIDFNGYIKSLTDDLFRSYGANGKIALKTDIEGVSLGVDTAIPCGLIINELVSNSLKHAFPEDREGEIKIALRRTDRNEVELVVSDDGIGIPEDLDFRNTESLGLQLVTSLAESQLQGKTELNRAKGTEFRIRFIA